MTLDGLKPHLHPRSTPQIHLLIESSDNLKELAYNISIKAHHVFVGLSRNYSKSSAALSLGDPKHRA